ncbi:MAG: glycine-rich domain-containing protein [Acidiphilium sp.]
MDRMIVYPGAIPLDTDILQLNRNVMVGIAALSEAVLGTSTIVDGLACSPTVPASLTVTIGPGSITALAPVDVTAYGSLAADIAEQIVKTGINLDPLSFTLSAPVSSGQSVSYLIEAAFSEADADPVVLPYVNAANPALPYTGPNNSGGAQNTQRLQRVQLQLKPGAAAPAGTQTAPPVDNGWVGLYVINVNYGQTAINSSDITMLPQAPFLPFKLPALRPGFAQMSVFETSGAFVVPQGVTNVKVTVIGGGGGGGYHATLPGAGGGAGGVAVSIIGGLAAGQSIPVTVGLGGAPSASPGTGGAGGTSGFGSFISASGGAGGEGGTASLFATAGGPGGIGLGGQINQAGAMGSDGMAVASRGGDGGGPGHGRGASGPLAGFAASGFGGGGGGGGASPGANPAGSPGGAGAPGLVIVEY